MTIEEPTMEFRQVTRYIDYTHRDYSGCGVGLGSELKGGATQVVVSVQRKWYIYEGSEYVGPFNTFERDDARFVMFDTDRTKAIWQPRRAEWRDLPTYTPKAGEGGYV